MATTLLPLEKKLNLHTLENQLLIIDHTHLEIMQAFEQLSFPEQQRVQELWEARISRRWK